MKTKAVLFAVGMALWASPLLGILFSPVALAWSVTDSALLPNVMMAQVAEETAPEPPKKAVMSFSGTGNKTVTVVDHRTNTVETRATSSLSLNQLKNIRVEGSSKPAASSEEESVGDDPGETADAENAGEDESKPSADTTQTAAKPKMTEAEKKAAHEADLRDGIKTLQGEGLIVYGDGDALPETIYDPFKKQYVPIEQAVRELRDRQEKAESEAASKKY